MGKTPSPPFNRPSQIACTVKTVHLASTETALRLHENSCAVLIPLSKDNLNLPLSFPSSLHLVASFSRSSCCHARSLALLCWFISLFVFTEAKFIVQPYTRTLLVNLTAGFFENHYMWLDFKSGVHVCKPSFNLKTSTNF